MHPQPPTPEHPDRLPDPDLAALLRLEVGLLRRRAAGRRFAPVLHLGRPGGCQHSIPLEDVETDVLDAATRVDLVGVLLDTGGPEPRPTLWLTRPGDPEAQDEDLAWLAAAHVAAGARQRPVPACYAVTPTGWVDVHTGQRRTWKRLRL